jgi:hypothetical protein
MNLNDLLTVLSLLAMLVVLAVALRNESRHDGLGRRPPPRSRLDEVESRTSLLQRLS